MRTTLGLLLATTSRKPGSGGFRSEVQPRRQHWFLNEKSGFPFRTPAFCSVSRGQRRLGEKEYRAPSATPGVALRDRTQASPFGEDDECSTGVAPAQEAFADEALDGLLGHPMLVDALRLPKERGTGDVAPQRGRRERKHLSIGHRLFASAMRRAKGTGGSANFQAGFRRGQARRVNRPQRLTPEDP